MTTKHEEIIQQLLADGWREFPATWEGDGVKAFGKTFEGHAKCKCNSPKNKQIEIYFHRERRVADHTFPPRFEVRCVGELPSNQWLRMRIESLKTMEEIKTSIDSLFAAWDAAVKSTPYAR